MLERGEPVQHHRQIGLQFARTLGGQQHVLFARRLGEPDPLIAPRLLIHLDHPCAVRLHPLHLAPRIVEARDFGELRRVDAAVEDVARRVDARAEHQAGLDELALREHVERRRRRVVDGGHAVGEIGGVLPFRLREDLEAGVVQSARASRPCPA